MSSFDETARTPGVSADQAEELEQFRELTKLIPLERLKALAAADARGMVLMASMPIGTKVYQIHCGESEETRIIDGEEYTRKVPNWYVTHHDYSWVDAMVDAENPDRANNPCCRYYPTKEDAFAERDRINAGGDPYATGGSAGESAGAYADAPTLAQPGA